MYRSLEKLIVDGNPITSFPPGILKLNLIKLQIENTFTCSQFWLESSWNDPQQLTQICSLFLVKNKLLDYIPDAVRKSLKRWVTSNMLPIKAHPLRILLTHHKHTHTHTHTLACTFTHSSFTHSCLAGILMESKSVPFYNILQLLLKFIENSVLLRWCMVSMHLLVKFPLGITKDIQATPFENCLVPWDRLCSILRCSIRTR
jgi:hypothetical protein